MKKLCKFSNYHDTAYHIEIAVSGGRYAACIGPSDNQPHIDCGNSYSHSSCDRTEAPKQYCDPKSEWTGWVTVGSGVGNPCPNNCERGDEIGLACPRSVSIPPNIQFKQKFECLIP